MNDKEKLINLAEAVAMYQNAWIHRKNIKQVAGRDTVADLRADMFTKANKIVADAQLSKSIQASRLKQFANQIDQWADDYFRYESGHLDKPLKLADVVNDFRFRVCATTIQPFISCLQSWANKQGYVLSVGTHRFLFVPAHSLTIITDVNRATS